MKGHTEWGRWNFKLLFNNRIIVSVFHFARFFRNYDCECRCFTPPKSGWLMFTQQYWDSLSSWVSDYFKIYIWKRYHKKGLHVTFVTCDVSANVWTWKRVIDYAEHLIHVWDNPKVKTKNTYCCNSTAGYNNLHTVMYG